jgi:hypothetical protein
MLQLKPNNSCASDATTPLASASIEVGGCDADGGSKLDGLDHHVADTPDVGAQWKVGPTWALY